MRKTITVLCVCLCFFIFSGNFLTAKTDPAYTKCKEKLEKEILVKDKVLVLKVGGIPTVAEYLPGTISVKTSHGIIIKNNKWKERTFLGGKYISTNVLEEKEILIITKVEVWPRYIKIRTVTDRAMVFDAGERSGRSGKGAGVHANMWTFKLHKKWTCEEALEAIETYFEIHDSKESVKQAKELKLGMTMEEVISILGEPQKKADMGTKIVYKYEDTIITFIEGKVTDIQFR